MATTEENPLAARLNGLADEASGMFLARKTPEHQEWFFRSIGLLRQVFGPESHLEVAFRRLDFGGAEPLSNMAGYVTQEMREYSQRFSEDKAAAVGILRAAAAEAGLIRATRDNDERTAAAALKDVFIIHGHDDSTLHLLARLLGERWGIKFRILRERPNAGRTLIQKLVEEASDCRVCFALFTPDDLVGELGQARPNVVFELGWFIGARGIRNCSILFKKGTDIPSDLAGVARIEFAESINEKIEEIERELRAWGLIE